MAFSDKTVAKKIESILKQLRFQQICAIILKNKSNFDEQCLRLVEGVILQIGVCL